jgi:hypothetical protein
MIFDQVKTLLGLALKELIEKDFYLIQNDVSERAITHKLAMYLEPYFTDYSIDCEYNRNAEDGERKTKTIKILVDEENILIDRFRRRELEIDEIALFSTYPDIIVHHRGVNSGNLLIVEAKKTTCKVDPLFDSLKLKAYTGTTEEDKYRYEWGASILFNVEKPTSMPITEWYKNGEIYAEP